MMTYNTKQEQKKGLLNITPDEGRGHKKERLSRKQEETEQRSSKCVQQHLPLPQHKTSISENFDHISEDNVYEDNDTSLVKVAFVVATSFKLEGKKLLEYEGLTEHMLHWYFPDSTNSKLIGVLL